MATREKSGPGSGEADTKVQVVLPPFPTMPLPRRTLPKHTFLSTLKGLKEKKESLATHTVLTHLEM